MSELSKVLGDLYGDSDPDGAPVRKEASAEERMNAAAVEGAKALDEEGVVDDDLAAALSSALESLPVTGAAASVAAEEAEEWAEKLEERERRTQADRLWQRSDDDVIPRWDRKRNKRRRG